MIEKKIKYYEQEVKFFENKLKNKNFLSKAPLKIVNENKAKLKEALKKFKFINKIFRRMYKIKFNDVTLISNKKKIQKNKIIFFFMVLVVVVMILHYF